MKKPDAPSKSDNRYTQQSQYSSQESVQFNGGFQFQQLTSPKSNRSKFNQLQGKFKSQLKIRQPDDIKKPSIALVLQPSNNNLLSVNEPKQQNQGSFIDIKVSYYPSNGELDSVKQVEVQQNLNSEKSFQNLHSSGKLEATQLRKSQTQPKFVSVKNYEGFQIKTNYVQQQRDFKKQKNQTFSVKNSNSMTFLNGLASPKNSNMHASRVINDTRITLKDYIFMANTSSKQAAQAKRKQLKQTKKLNTQPSTISMKSNQSSTISNNNIRQRFHRQKYHMDNDQMGIIVKQSIQQQLMSLKEKMQTVNQWMNSHRNIQNQQLIQLYSIRRELQEYNNKLNQSFQRLNITQNRQFVHNICQMRMAPNQNNQQVDSDIEMLTQI